MSPPDPRTASLLALAEEYAGDALHRFRPWVAPGGVSPQREFVRAAAHSRKRVFRAGNKVGKTCIVAWDAVALLCGRHPFARLPRYPATAWISAVDWEWGVGQDLWPAVREFLPAGCTVYYHRQAEPELPRMVVFPNGSHLMFKTAESGRRKYQGTALDLLVLNEEHPASIVQEARRGLVTRGGLLTVALTPVDRQGWVRALEAEQGTSVVRGSLTDAAAAGIADAAAVADWLAPMSERTRAMRERGDFVDVEGLVYPAWQGATHLARPDGAHLVLDGQRIAPWPLPAAWPRYAAMDFGYSHPACVLIAAHDRGAGRLVVYRCLYASFVRHRRWAEILTTQLPALSGPLVCDHDAAGRAELEESGVATCPARKAFEPGLEVVERLLGPGPRDGLPQLVGVIDGAVHPELGRMDCAKLDWEMGNYRYPEDREGRPMRADRPIKRDDHAMDTLRYLSVDVWLRASRRQPGMAAGLVRSLGVGMV